MATLQPRDNVYHNLTGNGGAGQVSSKVNSRYELPAMYQKGHYYNHNEGSTPLISPKGRFDSTQYLGKDQPMSTILQRQRRSVEKMRPTLDTADSLKYQVDHPNQGVQSHKNVQQTFDKFGNQMHGKHLQSGEKMLK